MGPADKFSVWAAYAGTSRAWVQSMDAKAGFITAIALGLIAALWTSAALTNPGLPLLVICAGGTTTLFAIGSIFCALLAVLPRESLSRVFGGGHNWSVHYHPISFYGYVAKQFKLSDYKTFRSYVDQLDLQALAEEALEQHFVMAHTVAAKSSWVERSGYLLMAAFVGAAVTLIARLTV